jgi:hypothetical protein
MLVMANMAVKLFNFLLISTSIAVGFRVNVVIGAWGEKWGNIPPK